MSNTRRGIRVKLEHKDEMDVDNVADIDNNTIGVDGDTKILSSDPTSTAGSPSSTPEKTETSQIGPNDNSAASSRVSTPGLNDSTSAASSLGSTPEQAGTTQGKDSVLMDDDDDDDPVVHEITVKLASTMKDNLYVFQYPNRPSSLPYDNMVCGRMKPKQHNVELQFALNTQSTWYDQTKGRQFAENGLDHETGEYLYDSDLMDKHFLSSSRVKPTATYCCGVLNNDELHLTPVLETLQLRPNFVHLDKYDPNLKKKKDAENSKRPVGVKKPLSSQERRLKQLESEIEDEWVPLSIFSDKTVDFHKVFNRLYCNSDHHYEFPQEKEDYFKILSGNQENKKSTSIKKKEIKTTDAAEGDEKEDKSSLPTIPNDYSSTGLINALEQPLEKRVALILRNAQVIHFQRLQNLAKCSQYVSHQVLDVIANEGVLVHGCWVIKSKHIFPKNLNPRTHGYSGEILANLRNYILYRFATLPNASDSKKRKKVVQEPVSYGFCAAETEDKPSQVGNYFDPQNHGQHGSYEHLGFLKRKYLIEKFDVSFDVVTMILKRVATLHAPYGWAFKLETDEEFIQRYPTFVDREKVQWEMRAKTNRYHENSNTKMKEEDPNLSPAANSLAALLEVNGVLTHKHLETLQTMHRYTSEDMDSACDELLMAVSPTWLRAEDEELYIAKSVPGVDPDVRGVIIKMLENDKSIRRLDTKTPLLRENLGEMTASVWTKIIRPIANRKGSYWTMKYDEYDE